MSTESIMICSRNVPVSSEHIAIESGNVPISSRYVMIVPCKILMVLERFMVTTPDMSLIAWESRDHISRSQRFVVTPSDMSLIARISRVLERFGNFHGPNFGHVSDCLNIT